MDLHEYVGLIGEHMQIFVFAILLFIIRVMLTWAKVILALVF